MNLFKKATASVALVALVSGVFSTGVSAYSTSEVEAANMLASEGIINSQSDVANYNLDQNVLRQEIAKVAANMAGISAKATCDDSFTDVSATTPNDWACGYVEALLDAGKVSANETFRPEDNISKSEAVKMVLEAAGFTNIYTDAATWQEEVVAFAADNGVTNSFTNYNTPATRGFIFEAAANAVVATEEDDSDDILSEILGGLDEDEETTDEEDEETTVVISGDNVLVAELSPETPASGNVAAGVSRTELVAFDVTAGSEDVTLDEITLSYTGLGDSSQLTVLSVYSNNEKITKSDSKSFDSDNEATLSFDSDTVIKAGETKTLFVTATVGTNSYNQSHQIAVTEIEASTEVELSSIVGATLTPINVVNKAQLEIKNDKATDDVVIGESVKIAGFKLEETTDKEDVIVKSISFTVDGDIDAEDDLSDLVLLADGEEVTSDLYVNNDDEIIANIDVVIPADEKVEFELRGTVTGSIGEDIQVIFDDADDIYAVGATTGINTPFEDGTDLTAFAIADSKIIEGSEINVSFDKSDIDEAKPSAEGVLVGELVISTVSDYVINKLLVNVTSSETTLHADIDDIDTGVGPTNTAAGVIDAVAAMNSDFADDYETAALDDGTAVGAKAIYLAAADNGVTAIIQEVEVEGSSYDSTENDGGSSDTDVDYVFEDIVLEAGEEYTLPITIEVSDETIMNGSDLTFNVVIDEVEDEENDKTYSVSDGNIDEVLSATSFNTKTVSVESASFDLVASRITDRELVLGNGVEVLLYKGKISVGDSDDVTITEFNLNDGASTFDGAVNLDDVLTSAVLNIGGKTFDGDVETTTVEFDSLNAVIAAGSNNVEVAVTATLTDDDTVVSGDYLKLAFASVELEDSEGEEVMNVTTSAANNYNPMVTLNDEGKFTVEVVTGGDREDDIEEVVLAGSSNVALAEVEIEAEDEDMKVKELEFRINTDGVDAVAQESTATVGGTFETGDKFTITIDGTDYTHTVVGGDTNNDGIATALATLVDANTNVSAVAAANVVTVTADTAGTAFTFATDVIDAGTSDATLTAATPTPNVAAVIRDFSTTLDNVRLMNGSKVIAEGAIVKFVSDGDADNTDGDYTSITFDEDFIVDQADGKIAGTLVADLNTVTTEGGAVSATLGDIEVVVVDPLDSNVKGVNSNEEIDTTVANPTTADTVTVVPALVTVSIDNTLGSEDQYARIEFSIDKGSNDLDSDDVKITEIELENALSHNVSIRNDDNSEIVADTGATITLTTKNEIVDGDEFEFKVDDTDDGAEIRIVANGIKFTIDGNEYTITNDKVIDLGVYDAD